MRISEILKQRTTFSFEVFPPKADKPIQPLMDTLEQFYALEPDYISCTYGAGGSNRGRNLEVASAIQSSLRTQAVTHFTCIGSSREEIDRAFEEYARLGIENVLALRGDFPAGWEGTRGAFAHANTLIAYLHQKAGRFCIGGAAYPEKHVQALSFDMDLAFLKAKQDNGAEFFTTQMCNDVPAFERFRDRARHAGVTVPIIAGVMPALHKDGLVRMTLSNGCSIPRQLAEIIGRYGDDPEAFKQAGKEYTVRLLHAYMAAGAEGVHLYTLNRAPDITDIVRASGIR